MKIKTFPVYLIFLAMGLIDSVGPMVSLAKESFKISTAMASLLPMLGYIMYGLLSVPIGLLQDKKGKKFIMNLGLSIALTGLIIPIVSGMFGKMVVDSSSLMQFYKILAAILLLGAGGAILQVSGNPVMRDISEAGQYSKNLSLAQSFITIGSSLGFLLPVVMFHAFGLDWSILFPFFAGIVLMGIIWINSIRIRERSDSTDNHATFRSCFSLLKNGYVFMMVAGIFIYCGVEIAMSAHVPILLKEKFNVSVEKMGLLISWSLFYLPILSGRFLGSWIMSRITPKRLLLLTVLFSLLGFGLIFSNSFVLTLIGIFFVGLGFANIFPLIFSITIDYMPGHTNALSGLMVSAIIGGAFIPPVMGMVADSFSIQIAFIVPVLSILYLLCVAIVNNVNISKTGV
ncbi:MFS transporter [Agriterribacter sp.]|jgi:fucose permease|uniref:MFS transporter n=1 Tax=Agriterribacter sp. TaxID=2821509 RepID=UPI002B849B98|nr:MFS transporter [Agriterribacter sp.]HRQ17893.1 MFS transporter [Agriterribacter sp.]